MQKKKKEISDAIMAHAEQEFYEHGFEKASIRRIIKSSGTTIGNFYNYFDSKEALLESLVAGEHEKFIAFMSQHEHEGNQLATEAFVNSKDFMKNLPEIISGLLPDFNMRFVILIEGCKGTKYENVHNNLVNLISEHIAEHGEKSGVKISSEIGRLLAVHFLDGIVNIVKSHKNDLLARNKLITEFLLFYFISYYDRGK